MTARQHRGPVVETAAAASARSVALEVGAAPEGGTASSSISSQSDRHRSAVPGLALHIERMVLDGVGLQASEAARLRGVIEAELERLFAGAQLRTPASALARRHGPSIHTTPHPSATTLGIAIAASLYTVLHTEPARR